MTAVSVDLAARMIRLPQLVTCETVPGAEDISSMARVWMESTITRSKLPVSMVLAMSLAEVEAAKLSRSESAPRRSARSLTCPADSSPETYKTS